MNLNEIIINTYPELLDISAIQRDNIYILQNDSDGFGDYIAKWEYSKPLPEGMKVGKI